MCHSLTLMLYHFHFVIMLFKQIFFSTTFSMLFNCWYWTIILYWIITLDYTKSLYLMLLEFIFFILEFKFCLTMTQIWPKKKWWPKFGPKWPKLVPKWGVSPFFQVWFISVGHLLEVKFRNKKKNSLRLHRMIAWNNV